MSTARFDLTGEGQPERPRCGWQQKRSTLTLMNVYGVTPIRLPFVKLGRISYIQFAEAEVLSTRTLH